MSSSEIQFGAATVACPDGQARVVVQFTTGAGQMAVIIDADQAPAFVKQLGAAINNAAADARRANSGILVPGPGMPTIAPLNGQAGPLPPALRGTRPGPVNGHGHS